MTAAAALTLALSLWTAYGNPGIAPPEPQDVARQELGDFDNLGFRLSPLDSCNLLLDELNRRLKTDPALVSQQEFTRLFELLYTQALPSDQDEEQRYVELTDLVRQTYTSWLLTLDILPNEVDAWYLWGGIAPDFQPDTLADEEPVDRKWFDIDEFFGESSTVPPTSHEPLPPVRLEDNRSVRAALDYYCKRGRPVMQRWFDRAPDILPIIKKILREEGMPEELVFLSMIESGFNLHAYSWAHAAGPWQFLAATGRRYGLEVSWWYDERRDPVKSTRAAAAYLRELYGMFGDWYLAMAAYNCGENKVKRHVRNYGNDYWKLRRLPRQTRNYVPSFVAATLIAADPDKYGFTVSPMRKQPALESVWITDCVDMASLAEAAKVGVAEFKALNPSIVRWCTPPDLDSVLVNIPAGTADEGFWDRVAAIPPEKRVSYIRHRVRSGETLSTIAARYGVPMSLIIRHPENRISNKHRIGAGQMLVIPGVPEGSAAARAVVDEPVSAPTSGIHMVRRGQTLSGIAARYGLSVDALRRLNGIYRTSTIYPGQKLRISGSDSEVASIHPNTSGMKNYVVSRGDTLWDIAKNHGISIDALYEANNLGRRSIIKPGQQLLIPVAID